LSKSKSLPKSLSLQKKKNVRNVNRARKVQEGRGQAEENMGICLHWQAQSKPTTTARNPLHTTFIMSTSSLLLCNWLFFGTDLLAVLNVVAELLVEDEIELELADKPVGVGVALVFAVIGFWKIISAT
jgi:hypothetical protein